MSTFEHREQLVRQFHDKHAFDVDLFLPAANVESLAGDLSLAGTQQLKIAAAAINAIAQQWCNGTVNSDVSNTPTTHDTRLLRAHLVLEEAAEMLEALADRNQVGLLDALADLQYVVSGTAVAFKMPLGLAFEEVHRSNMTKEVKAGGDKDVRCRKKGENYRPPNLEQFLGKNVDTQA